MSAQLLVVPSRLPARSAVKELSLMADSLIRNCEAVAGLYRAMTDLIREAELTDEEVRGALDGKFPQPRISEILRVCRASDDVYHRYRAGFFGFKAALAETRGYTVTPSRELFRRKLRRTAERLVKLAGDDQTEIEILGRKVVIYATE